jgi:hypothetical protein
MIKKNEIQNSGKVVSFQGKCLPRRLISEVAILWYETPLINSLFLEANLAVWGDRIAEK